MHSLIYRRSLTSSDGTTIQLNRLLAPENRPLLHFWWDESGTDHDYPDNICGLHLPEHECWQWRSHGALRVPLYRLCPLPVFAPRTFDRQRVQCAIKSRGERVTAAHVVVYDETQSSHASDILAALDDPPFVVQLMDVLEAMPLDERRYRNLRQLCRRASTVLCISPLLAEAVRSSTGATTEVLPVCADPYSFSLPVDLPRSSAFRIALLGTVYRRDVAGDARMLGLLAEAWPEIQRKYPNAQLIYVGHSFAEFPETLQPFVTNLGPLSATACLDMLAQCSAACLTASYTSASAFRYSVPSRLADFLAAGLPVVACVSPNTAVAEFLTPLEGHCAAFANNAGELAAALRGYLDHPERRTAHAAFARQFALRDLDARTSAQLLRRCLEAAASQ